MGLFFMNNTFTVGNDQAGKSLSDLYGASQASGQYVPDLGALQQLTGLDPNAKLTAGQNIAFNKNDPGSGEYKYLSTVFGAPMSGGQAAQNSATAAYQPAINTLQAQKDPLKARYDSLIKDIQNNRDQALQTAGINSAVEFGKRGLSTDSGQYGQYLQQQDLGVNNQFQNQIDTTANNATNADTSLAQAIASIQSQGAGAGIQANQFATNTANTLNQNAIQNQLAQQQFGLDQQKANQSNPTQLTTFSQGGVTYAFNPTTGDVKPLTSSGNNGISGDIFSPKSGATIG